MFTAPWQELSAPLEMALMTAFGTFLSTAFIMSKSGATDRNFIIHLTSFNLLDIRLSSNCELPLRIFKLR